MDIFFYITALPVNVAALLWFYKSKKPPFYSLSFLLFIINFVFIILPGYFVYRGYNSIVENTGINETAYLLVIFQAVVLPLIVWAGWQWNSYKRITIKPKQLFVEKYSFYILVVFIYSAIYLYFNEEAIPLIAIFRGDLADAAFRRTLLTHDLGSSDLPVLLNYSRPITKDLMFLLLLPLCGFRPIHKSVLATISFIALLFFLLMQIEKSYALYLLLGLLMAKQGLERKIRLRAIVGIIFLSLLVSLTVTYFFFAGTLINSIDYLLIRLIGQAGYVVPQIQIAEEFGTLGVHGINFGIVGKMLGINYIDISKLAFESERMATTGVGMAGSSAGIAIAELYYAFGIFAFVVYPLLLFIIVSLDSFFYKVYEGAYEMRDGFESNIGKTFYVYFVCFYSLAVFGGVFSVISPYSLFAPTLLISILIFLSFFKVRMVPVKISAAK